MQRHNGRLAHKNFEFRARFIVGWTGHNERCVFGAIAASLGILKRRPAQAQTTVDQVEPCTAAWTIIVLDLAANKAGG